MKIKLVYKITFLVLIVSLWCCKKQIDQIKANAVVDVMVSGKWEVQQYLSGTTDVSSEFAGYEFQFFRDNSVTGTDGTITTRGTWNGDAGSATISASFPNGTNPLARLNGTWGVYSYNSSGPKFNQTINGVEAKLTLRKK